MCGIVGAASTRNIVPILIDGIRRLEYRGYDSTGVAVINGAADAPRLARLVSTARVADLAAQAKARQARRRHRHFAHALGDARRADVRQRASAHVARRDRGGPQRHHRELRGAARAPEAQGYVFGTQTDTEVIAASRALRIGTARRRRPAARGADGRRGIPRRLRDRRDLGARAGARRRRARRQPAGRRHRRRATTSSRRMPRRCCR